MTDTNEPKRTKTDKNKTEPKPMIINGEVLVPFDVVSVALGKLLPDGATVVGYRVKGSDLVLNTNQVIDTE